MPATIGAILYNQIWGENAGIVTEIGMPARSGR
jgi:hypothetical protein